MVACHGCLTLGLASISSRVHRLNGNLRGGKVTKASHTNRCEVEVNAHAPIKSQVNGEHTDLFDTDRSDRSQP